ncbi:MAG: hypothetical protein LBO63_08465, partial [Oscillospiraceae bacterium]|nr:hypothetical protein [Oscillospiraceae bacterium]
AKLGSFALLHACAAGGYFFRFAGKSNQKGATSLEEAIFFIRELRWRQGGLCLSPRRIAVVAANACAAPHAGAKPVAGLVTWGTTVADHELRWGGYRTWRSTPAPRLRCVVRQVGALPVATRCAD